MNIEDGNGAGSGPSADKAVAQAMVNSLRGGALPVSREPAAVASWMQFATALDRLVETSPDLKSAIEESIGRSARYALVSGDHAVPSTKDFVTSLRGPEMLARGGTVVRAFWWGFHIQISKQDLDAFVATAAPVNDIIGAIGGGIPSPAAPFIALAAAFVAGALGLLQGLDRGNGVYISMSWFAPGVFVPTSV